MWADSHSDILHSGYLDESRVGMSARQRGGRSARQSHPGEDSGIGFTGELRPGSVGGVFIQGPLHRFVCSSYVYSTESRHRTGRLSLFEYNEEDTSCNLVKEISNLPAVFRVRTNANTDMFHDSPILAAPLSDGGILLTDTNLDDMVSIDGKDLRASHHALADSTSEETLMTDASFDESGGLFVTFSDGRAAHLASPCGQAGLDWAHLVGSDDGACWAVESLHPLNMPQTVATGDDWGALCIWDIRSMPTHPVRKIVNETGGITSIHALSQAEQMELDIGGGSLMLVGDYGGTLRLCDVRALNRPLFEVSIGDGGDGLWDLDTAVAGPLERQSGRGGVSVGIAAMRSLFHRTTLINNAGVLSLSPVLPYDGPHEDEGLGYGVALLSDTDMACGSFYDKTLSIARRAFQ
ncbi:hypothetical protein KIPB_005630 [Kipferlia bialata]|uniref:Uncharacterized protein n=1 Tax=Kipferlia bialata TaxID=797122 RepID=A0A9K3CYW1_9EUKA|nr:hypothetical protein KIPB_005630 [Kipferlia bialata]|eukprot:g5630.t1